MRFREGSNEERAYQALNKWSHLLNAWEYNEQFKKNKNRRPKQFIPHWYSLVLIEAMKELVSGNATADEAMALLHTVDGSTQLRLCMEAEASKAENAKDVLFIPERIDAQMKRAIEEARKHNAALPKKWKSPNSRDER